MKITNLAKNFKGGKSNGEVCNMWIAFSVWITVFIATIITMVIAVKTFNPVAKWVMIAFAVAVQIANVFVQISAVL